MKESEYEIIEPGDEFPSSSKGEQFSHSALVMMAYRKVIENGSREMREGYWNTKFDRMGNAHNVWIPDSREEFKESVNTLKMIMIRDMDDEAKKEITEIEKGLADKYFLFCQLEKRDWTNAQLTLKEKWKKEGSFFREGFLSRSLPYAFEYIEEEVKTARRIVEAIGKLIKRMYDYGEIALSV